MPKKNIKKHVKKAIKNKKKRKVILISLTVIVLLAVLATIVAINQGVITTEEIRDYINQVIGIEETPPDTNNPENTEQNSSLWSDNILLVGDELSGDMLEMHFIDVGQGDSILIEFPDGKIMLIDGGDTTIAAREAILDYLDRLEIEIIDYMILTHPHSDHVGALDEVLEYYPVKSIYMPNLISSYGMEGATTILQSYSTKAYNNFYELVFVETYMDEEIEKQASVIYNEDVIVISEESYTFTMYCPEPEYYSNVNYNSSGSVINNMSPVCVLEYGERFVVLTGDAELMGENRFIEQTSSSFDADILKVGHHGSETSSNDIFLENISVEYAVILTDGTSHDHPRQLAIDRLLASGVEYIFRSDLHSDINILIDQNGNMQFQVVNYVEYEDTIIGH